jgi:hypothetical protein
MGLARLLGLGPTVLGPMPDLATGLTYVTWLCAPSAFFLGITL